jgi:uncharacterized protein
MDKQQVIDRTRGWIEGMVIGLNLCPFARRVFEADLIRYVVSDAREEAALLADLRAELELLAAPRETTHETTLLIHPHLFPDFLEFNDFLDPAERAIADMDLAGVIQIASFHPHYQFAGTDVDAVENYTNRSPYPMLHLLREASITAVASDEDELAEIPRRNIETLRGMGIEQILERLRGTSL